LGLNVFRDGFAQLPTLAVVALVDAAAAQDIEGCVSAGRERQRVFKDHRVRKCEEMPVFASVGGAIKSHSAIVIADQRVD
jgi:hypothetical protein